MAVLLGVCGRVGALIYLSTLRLHDRSGRRVMKGLSHAPS